jgi:hypothetical protein
MSFEGASMNEDRHIQFSLNGQDYDLILRVDEEGREFVAFDIFDYDQQETVLTKQIGVLS